MSDPIRDRMYEQVHYCVARELRAEANLLAALLAVLDLCDDGPDTLQYEMVQATEIRRAVAKALGISHD